MYDLMKRAYFSTLGELRMLLKDMPDNTLICTCGNDDNWLHFSLEENLVSIDYERFGYVYCEDLEEICPFSHDDCVAEIEDLEETLARQQIEAHNKRMSAMR